MSVFQSVVSNRHQQCIDNTQTRIIGITLSIDQGLMRLGLNLVHSLDLLIALSVSATG